MKLLGAKEFLRTVKPGTLCVEFWLSHEEDCLELIKDRQNGVDLLEKYSGEFYIFGDNGGSLAFIEDEDEETIEGVKYNCLCYYDKNIVGDASPWTTLQLVYETEDEWPEEICVGGDIVLHKDDIRRIRDWFLKTEGPFTDETSDDKFAWALKHLEEEEPDHKIINYKEAI